MSASTGQLTYKPLTFAGVFTLSCLFIATSYFDHKFNHRIGFFALDTTLYYSILICLFSLLAFDIGEKYLNESIIQNVLLMLFCLITGLLFLRYSYAHNGIILSVLAPMLVYYIPVRWAVCFMTGLLTTYIATQHLVWGHPKAIFNGIAFTFLSCLLGYLAKTAFQSAKRHQEAEQMLQRVSEDNRFASALSKLEGKTEMAVDMHDNLGCQLTLLHLYIEELNSMELSDEVRQKIERVERGTRQMRKTFDSLVQNNHQQGTKTLEEYIRLLIRDIATVDIVLDIRFDAFQSVLKRYATSFFTETLSNALRHSNASQIIVTSKFDAGIVTFQTHHCGRTTPPVQWGIGLKTLSEKCVGLSGQFKVDNQQGFLVAAKFEL